MLTRSRMPNSEPAPTGRPGADEYADYASDDIAAIKAWTD